MKAQVKLEKVDVLLSQTSTSLENSALLAELLPLPNHGRYNEPELTPQQRRCTLGLRLD